MLERATRCLSQLCPKSQMGYSVPVPVMPKIANGQLSACPSYAQNHKRAIQCLSQLCPKFQKGNSVPVPIMPKIANGLLGACPNYAQVIIFLILLLVCHLLSLLFHHILLLCYIFCFYFLQRMCLM